MDYQKIIDERNVRNLYAVAMGIRVTELEPGRAKVVLTAEKKNLNPLGRVHGGCLFGLADAACGAAASIYGKAVTLNANYNFLRGAAEGDTITAEARETKHVRTISVFDITLTNQTGDVIGTSTMTFYYLPAKPGADA